MRLRTKLVLTASGLTFAIVLVLSTVFLSQLLRQRIELTFSANDVLAKDVRLATIEAVETGLRAHPPPDAAEDPLHAAVMDALRSGQDLQSAMDRVVRYSEPVQDVSVTDAHGFTMVSTDPDAINQRAAYRDSFPRLPGRHAALSEEERRYIQSGQEQHLQGDGSRPSILAILRRRNFWGIALPRFLADPTWGTLTFWLPLYLTTVRHMNIRQIALFAWMPFLAADFGCLFGGLVSMTLQKYAGATLINARRATFTLGACLMLGVGFVGFVQSPYAAIALLSLAGFAHQTLSVTVITMSSDLFKKNEVATVAGMAGTFGNAGLLIFSLAIGGLVATIGYTPFFICLGIFDLIGAALLWTLVKVDLPSDRVV